MEKLDELLLNAMSEKVFAPERVTGMLKELQDRSNKSQSHNDLHLQTLKKELDDLKCRMGRLCDAMENGILPDDIAQERSRKIQTRRQAVLAEIAGLRSQHAYSLNDFGPKQINTFCKALRTKLSNKESNFGKDYLKLLVEDIRIEGKEVRMYGKYTDVVNAMRKNSSGLSSWIAQNRKCLAPPRGLEIRPDLTLSVRTSNGFYSLVVRTPG